MKLLLAALFFFSSQVTVQAATNTDADAIFAWAETIYPDLFAPAGQTSQSGAGYYYRFYPGSKSYLGFRADDQKIYYLLPTGPVSTAGDISTFLPQAALPPDSAEKLNAYLRAGIYRNWTADPSVHPSSTSAHPRSRIYFNPSVVDTLTKKVSHQAGASVVKEFYSLDNNKVTGWAVGIKIQSDSSNGNGWYWYETFSAEPGAVATQGRGISVCSNCHSKGQDYIRASLPGQ